MVVSGAGAARASQDARLRRAWAETAAPLLEREHELAVVHQVLDDVGSGISSAITVRGEPGVGRSALLRRAIEHANRLELAVLTATGSCLESELPLGVVSQLFESRGVPEHVARDSARDVLHGPSPDVLSRLRSALFTLARRRPVVVVVDDLQWADHPSQHWLQSVRRRLHEAPVVVLTANTEIRPAPADTGEALHSVSDHVLHPQPLTVAGVRDLLRAEASATVSGELADRVSAAGRGNPALLRAAQERLSSGTDVAEALPDCLAEARAEQVARVLHGLPPVGRRLLQAIVVCAGRFDFDVLCSVADLRVDSPLIVLDRLRVNRLVTPDDPPRSVDPAVDARVLAAMDSRERAALYTRAALTGHRAAVPDTDLAGLVLRAEPATAPWPVDVLRGAAHSECAQGRYESARRLLVRARQERMSDQTRAELLVELASAELTRAPDASDRLLADVLNRPDGAGSRLGARAADLLLARGNSVLAGRMVAACARDHAPDSDALRGLYWLATDALEGASELETCSFPDLPEVPVDPDQAGVAAWRLALRGRDADRARSLARAALPPSSCGGPLMPRVAACKALVLADEVADADAGLHAVLVDARRTGAPAVIAAALLARADLGTRTGRLDEAARDLSAALDVLPLRCWHPFVRPAVIALDVVLNVERGDRDGAEQAAAVDLPTESAEGAGWPHLLFARGVLLLTAGRPKPALEHFHECGRRLLSRQWNNPVLLPWRSLAAVASRACGAHAAASRLVTEELDMAHAWGAPTGVGVAQLFAYRALGRNDSAAEAAAILRESPARLRYAEALVDVAETESATDGWETRDHLREVSELASACGADGLTRRIRELSDQAVSEPGAQTAESRTGGKELSDAEARIVRLAVRGLANPGIARTLQISRRAVEMHLTNVYRKLGIAGRRELASACARLVEEI